MRQMHDGVFNLFQKVGVYLSRTVRMSLLDEVAFTQVLVHVKQKHDHTAKQLQEVLQAQLDAGGAQADEVVKRLTVIKELRVCIDSLLGKLFESLTGVQAVSCVQA